MKRLFIDGGVITTTTVLTFLILEPYALIEFKEFWRQTIEQSQMTRNAFTFPYTLQYVGKIPYLFELKNIFLWGQGPILATLSFVGALYVTLFSIRIHLRGGVAPAAHLGGETRGKQFNNYIILNSSGRNRCRCRCRCWTSGYCCSNCTAFASWELISPKSSNTSCRISRSKPL